MCVGGGEGRGGEGRGGGGYGNTEGSITQKVIC